MKNIQQRTADISLRCVCVAEEADIKFTHEKAAGASPHPTKTNRMILTRKVLYILR